MGITAVSSSEKGQGLRWPLTPKKKEIDVELSNLTPSPTFSHPTTHCARDRVLATPELLEAILLHLPLNELLTTAQLVSSTFHDTISDSISIQQALFFLPDLSPSAFGSPCPLLHHCGESTFSDERHVPLLPTEMTDWQKWPDRNDGLQPLMWQEYARKIKAYTVKGATWRRMLVVQPPIRELSLNGGNVLRNEVGVTMGQLENCFGDWREFVITKEGRGSLQARGNIGE
jgi:hypothetical protein